MTVLERTEIKLEWTDIESRVQHTSPRLSRASGVHLSGVIRHIAIASGLLESITDLDAEEMPLRMAMGMAWEEWAVGLYPDMIWQPGELSLDGISGNPDGFGVVQDEPAIEEFKLTWKSENTRKNILSEWMWLTQIKGYCRLMESRIGIPVRTGRLHVLWVNGDYRPPSPIYYRYLIGFTDNDINSNWSLMLNYRDSDGVRKE